MTFWPQTLSFSFERDFKFNESAYGNRIESWSHYRIFISIFK